MSFLRTYGKALLALLFALVTAAQAAISDGRITTVEDVQIIIAVVTAAGVYIVPIHPTWTWTKTVVAVLLAGLNVLVTVVYNGMSTSDWAEVILAVLTVLGVGAVPALSLPRGVPKTS